MHFMDGWSCVPITLCYPNPYQLSMDDKAAVARLYPVTAQNQSSFPGKQIFSSATARIHGSVYFTDAHGNRTQPMQGVNVVARWIDPVTRLPSRRYAASSVSGFSFRGNGGNPITGRESILIGRQELVLTSPGPVAPSGSARPITVTVSPGSDVQQDILMMSSAQPLRQTTSSWTAPLPLPSGGDWAGSLASYADVDYVVLRAQTNRTLSVSVTALDEAGQASHLKAQPVIGMWQASDPDGSVPGAFTPASFNQVPLGLTRLDASLLTPGNFLIGIADMHGDGRPDYRYHARVLYADSVWPARVGVNGGAVTLRGTGFSQGVSLIAGGRPATAVAATGTYLTLAVAGHADGVQSISVSDPVSGGSTTMTGALTYGAAATDNIVLLNGGNPQTPVGVLAANPVSVRVLASDGVTAVSGATVGWSSTNGVQLSACSGALTCSVITDQDGNAATWLTASAAGTAIVTATFGSGGVLSGEVGQRYAERHAIVL